MSTTNSSSPSFSSFKLSVLVDTATDLSDMLHEVESQALQGSSMSLNNTTTDQTPLYERVEAIIENILEKLFENPSHLVDSSLTYVCAKLESILQYLINFDLANATRYSLLSTRVKSYQNFTHPSSSCSLPHQRLCSSPHGFEENQGFDEENQCLFDAHNNPSIVSSTTSSSSSQLSVLVEHGMALSRALGKAKSQSEQQASTIILDGSRNQTAICKQVEAIVKNVHRKLCDNQAHLVQESTAHVMSKIDSVLQDFIKFDPSNRIVYSHLSTLVQNSQDSRQLSLASPSSSQVDHNLNDFELNQSFDFQDKFNKLVEEGRQCLYCFSLFPEGSEIERTVLTYWWVAMGLVDHENNKSGQILANLINEGFIRRTVNAYRVRTGIYSQLIDKAVNDISWRHSAILLQDGDTSSPSSSFSSSGFCPELNAENIRVVLNISKRTLDTEGSTLHCFAKRKNVVEIAQFGSWKQDLEDFIVVEDLNFLLKAMKYMGNLRLASLRGISGIMKLPRWMYTLMSNLRVLDLRACHDLELLPDGIESLQELTHLDLSECYLLKCVPKGITKLTKLRVLKGFIVNPNSTVTNDQTTKSTSSSSVQKLFKCSRDSPSSSSCKFKELSELQQLRKLAVRTRKQSFPSEEDLSTLCRLGGLQKLGIAWVGSAGDAQEEIIAGDFPNILEKLELQAVPKGIALRLLHLISSKDNLSLSKLYIIGGGIEELGSHLTCFNYVRQLRLRYLPHLQLDWPQCKRAFPNLTHIDIFQCPKISNFPNQSGIWISLGNFIR